MLQQLSDFNPSRKISSFTETLAVELFFLIFFFVSSPASDFSQLRSLFFQLRKCLAKLIINVFITQYPPDTNTHLHIHIHTPKNIIKLYLKSIFHKSFIVT